MIYKIKGTFIDKKGNYHKSGDMIELEDRARIEDYIQAKVIFEKPEKMERSTAVKSYPRRTSPKGNWYELSNGEKVLGLEKASQAEKILKEGELDG